MNVPADLRYTADHEWVRAEPDGTLTVGITDHAQAALGDLVFIELPKPGASFAKMGVFGTVEAVKAVSELFCPVAGEVIESNPALDGDPATVNRDPYGAGWMIRLKMSNPADLNDLLQPAAYEAKIGG